EKAGVVNSKLEKTVLDRQAQLIREEEEEMKKEVSKNKEKALQEPIRVKDEEAIKMVSEKDTYKKQLLQYASALEMLMNENAVGRQQQELLKIRQKLEALAADKIEQLQQEEKKAGTEVALPEGATESMSFGNEKYDPGKQDHLITDRSGKTKTTTEAAAAPPSPAPTTAASSEATTPTTGPSSAGEAAPAADTLPKEERRRARSERTLSRFSKQINFMLNNLETKLAGTENAIGATMKAFKDGDNITYDEVVKVMKEKLREVDMREDQISRIIQDLDFKGDGKISRDEIADVVKMLQEEMNESIPKKETSPADKNAQTLIVPIKKKNIVVIKSANKKKDGILVQKKKNKTITFSKYFQSFSLAFLTTNKQYIVIEIFHKKAMKKLSFLYLE
ncbi:hypothetical protein RFI_00425, partial [Reticulomyxa filosa]